MAVVGCLPKGGGQHLKRLSDDALAEQARTRNQVAFELLMERFQSRVRRYCERIIGDPGLAEDAALEAFLRAHRALSSRERDSSFSAWLFAIARNVALDHRTRARSHPEIGLDLAEEYASPHRVDDEVLMRLGLRAALADIAGLPAGQRRALVLRSLRGLDYREIASQLGISPKAASQAVREARAHLAALERGRAALCSDVQELLAEADRRRHRAVWVTAHLDVCPHCHDAANRRAHPARLFLGRPQPALADAAAA